MNFVRSLVGSRQPDAAQPAVPSAPSATPTAAKQLQASGAPAAVGTPAAGPPQATQPPQASTAQPPAPSGPQAQPLTRGGPQPSPAASTAQPPAPSGPQAQPLTRVAPQPSPAGAAPPAQRPPQLPPSQPLPSVSNSDPTALDFLGFFQGQHVNVGGVRLVRADLIDQMRRLTSHGPDLMVVSRDAHGVQLVAAQGDLRQGALLVTPANKAVGCLLTLALWSQLPWDRRPTTAIQIDGQTFVRLDIDERISFLATKPKQLKVIGEWRGMHLLTNDGDLAWGLLMVDKDYVAQGYWIPEWELRNMA